MVDLFAGSGNTLYWILRHLPQSRGLGFELDPRVFWLTTQNLSILKLPIEIMHADYVKALGELSVPGDELLIAFVAPPWGNALSSPDGLDLRRTTPPVKEVVDFLARHFGNPILFAVQVYERIVSASLADLTAGFDWSALRTYDLNSPGQNHGLLLMTRGWQPVPAGDDR